MASQVKRYVALDALRGLCACAVVLFHLHSTGVITNLALFKHSWIFVDFFFVLSGFVIAASYGERLKSGFPLREFMLLRFGRIYPLHVFVLALFLLFELIAYFGGAGGTMTRAPFTGSREPSAFFASLMLVQIFGFHGGVSWNVPSWSIAAEMWAYLLAALGARLFGQRLRWLLIATAIVAPILLTAIPPHDLDRTFSWSLVRCLYGFSLGWLVFELCARDWLSSRFAGMVEALIVAIVIVAVIYLPSGPLQLLYPPLFAAAVWAFAAERGPLSALLSIAPFRMLGDLSYSIYMVHYFVLGRLIDVATLAGSKLGIALTQLGDGQKLLAGPGLTPDLLAIIGLAGTIIVSWFTYRYVEVPFRAATRRLAERIGGRSARVQEAVAPTM